MKSQVFTNQQFGVKVSLIVTFGTNKQTIGCQLSSYYKYAFTQINGNYSIRLSANNLGGRKFLVENRFAPGINFFSNHNLNQKNDFIWNEIRQQGNGAYSIGYSYLLYIDNRGSDQKSGAFGIGLKDFFISFENDLFAGQGRDRFRTAQLELSYQKNGNFYSTGFQLWTGETRGSEWLKDSNKKHPFGYKTLDGLPYGKTSHGIWYAGFGQSLDYGNRNDFRVGIDDERIRDFLQNYLSHDLPFLPKSIERKTPHYPMLDSLGYSIINKGVPRKTKVFGSMGINGIWSY
jgi:hypothetical protein